MRSYLLQSIDKGSRPMSKLFISHSTLDMDYVNKVVDALDFRGIPYFIAPRDIPIGAYWEEVLKAAMRECFAGLFLWSQNSAYSEYCIMELEELDKAQKHVFPARLMSRKEGKRGRVHQRLKSRQSMDLSVEFNARLALLVEEIHQYWTLQQRPFEYEPFARLYRRGSKLETTSELLQMFGRETDIQRLRTALSAPQPQPTAVITGLPGIGKTFLVEKFLGECLTQPSPEVSTFVPFLKVDLGFQSDLDRIENAIYTGLQIKPEYREEWSIAEALRFRNVKLIVLEDVSHDDTTQGKADQENLLFELLKKIPNEIRILITSRRTDLKLGQSIQLEPLSETLALEMLDHFSESKGKLHAHEKARTICRQLGNHPFCLFIAARLLLHKLVSIDELEAEVSKSPDTSIERPTGDMHLDPSRKNFATLMDVTFHALNRQNLFVLVSIGGVYTVTGTRRILEIYSKECQQEINIFEVLIMLQQVGLLSFETAKLPHLQAYKVHELVHSYARGKFKSKWGQIEHDELKVMRGYIQFINEFKGETQTDRLAGLHLERANFLSAVAKAHSEKQYDDIINVMRILVSDSGYFSQFGHDARSLLLLNNAIEAARQGAENSDEHKQRLDFLLRKRGNYFLFYAKNGVGARIDYEQALRLASPENKIQKALVMRGIATTFYPSLNPPGTRFSTERDARIRQFLNRALRLLREQNDEFVYLKVLEAKAYYFSEELAPFFQQKRQEDPTNLSPREKKTLTNARKLFEALQNRAKTYLDRLPAASEDREGFQELYFQGIHNTAHVRAKLGNWQEAEKLYKEALPIAESLGTNHQAYTLQGLGEVDDHFGKRDEAEVAFDKALSLYSQSTDTQLRKLIRFMLHKNRPYRVAPEHLRMLPIMSDTPEMYQEAHDLINIALRVATERNHPEDISAIQDILRSV
jgi:hypothetical protein